jgi:NAD(P)-dependent dehydrogenase (short-subunit alcohol dehydrogenase family)
MLDFTGQTALVIGAASGIGESVASSLAALNAHVVAADINWPDEADGSNNLEQRRLDVADPTATAALIAEIAEARGKLDILVNTAAVTRYIDFLEVTPDEWDWIQGVNLRGLFFVTQAAAGQMARQGGGRIVNLSSVAGKDKHASNPVYACTKGAIITLGRNAAARFGRDNVTINTVCPGLTITPLVERNAVLRAAQKGVTPDVHLAEISSRSAVGRPNTPEDVANAVVFLVSPMARNITGQSINVDGGIVWD